MRTYQPIPELTVVAVRYRGSRPAQRDERSLNAYATSDVYAAADIPFHVVEPRFPEAQRSTVEPDNLGLIGGEIADAVANGLRAGHAVLMSGGDCSHITGVLGGMQDAYGATARIGLVWFDAHGDFNTPKTTISGMLGGMPVAVSAGLGYPNWRIGSHIAAPLPTERIVMVDVRNLDPLEKQLIDATAVTVAAVAPGFPGADLAEAIMQLSQRCDLIYLHIDSDVLDASLVPNHGTREPNGPNLEQVLAAVDRVMATGKVATFAVVSVYGEGEGYEISQQSGIGLIQGGLERWKKYGMAR
ncbi:MAG: arginase family protein [Caldilineaceae bacterium]